MSKRKKTAPVAVRYVGPGYWVGVPRRDLRDHEIAKYLPLIKDRQEASGVTLYEIIEETDDGAKDDAKGVDSVTVVKVQEEEDAA